MIGILYILSDFERFQHPLINQYHSKALEPQLNQSNKRGCKKTKAITYSLAV
jgi:hypothetical protein